tara:strand:- start:3016 stop:3681 length:666 start_codon:yes stop_codon:yes gene_type:complete
MFTGLVQSVGRVSRRGKTLLVEGCQPFSPLKLGDSIAVDGVCLTASELIQNGFFADVSEETLRRTTLGSKADIGGTVNLEPALRLSDRLGGHLVSGHIDGLGTINDIQNLMKSWQIQIQWQDKKFAKYICEKGSITVNGISLTVTNYSDHGLIFNIAVIPHTWENTSLNTLFKGDSVNLEADMIAKYTEKLVLDQKHIETKDPENSALEISREWLDSQGWN